jgi:hypothetical protein
VRQGDEQLATERCQAGQVHAQNGGVVDRDGNSVVPERVAGEEQGIINNVVRRAGRTNARIDSQDDGVQRITFVERGRLVVAVRRVCDARST